MHERMINDKIVWFLSDVFDWFGGTTLNFFMRQSKTINEMATMRSRIKESQRLMLNKDDFWNA